MHSLQQQVYKLNKACVWEIVILYAQQMREWMQRVKKIIILPPGWSLQAWCITRWTQDFVQHAMSANTYQLNACFEFFTLSFCVPSPSHLRCWRNQRLPCFRQPLARTKGIFSSASTRERPAATLLWHSQADCSRCCPHAGRTECWSSRRPLIEL